MGEIRGKRDSIFSAVKANRGIGATAVAVGAFFANLSPEKGSQAVHDGAD